MGKREKRINKELVELLHLSHERELATHLDKLYESFKAWKDGNLTAGELNFLIHKYHDGPSRRVYNHYNGIKPEMGVAQGLAFSLIRRDEISDESYSVVKDMVNLYQNQSKRTEK